MKILIHLSVFIFLSFSVTAQRYEWLSFSNQSIANYVAPVAVDPAGNVYMLIGTTSSGAVIQGDTIPCLTSGNGVIIAKFSATGNFLWGSIVNPDNGIIYGEKIAVDNNGSVYASINFPNGGSAHLTDTVFSLGGTTANIIKLNSSGNFVRARNFTSNSAPRISCLATDLYIGYQGTVARLDSALNTVWSITDPTGALEFGYTGFSRADIFVQTNGEIIVDAFEGYNNAGVIPFGNGTVNFSAGGYDEVAVVKLDTSGQVQWTKALQLNTGGQPNIRAVCLDHQGNAYLGAVDVNSQVIFANDTLVNTIGTGPYCAILKWNSTGTPVRGIGLYSFSSEPTLYDLAVNSQNELLVSGAAGSSNISINGDTIFPAFNNFFLFKFDAAGNFIWWKDASSSPPGSTADGIAVRNGNEYILAGSTINSISYQFGCLPLNSTNPATFVTLITEQPEQYPVAAFTYTVSNDTTYNFTNTSTNGTSFHWDFGDGDTSNLQNPSHNFAIGGNFTVVLTTYHGLCTSTDTLQVIGVGTDELNNTTSFLIFPNPSNGNFMISFRSSNTISSVDIYSVLGKNIFSDSNFPKPNQEISLENVSPGFYFVKIHDGKRFYCEKIIVNKD